MKRLLILLVSVQLLLASCSPVSKKQLSKRFIETENQFRDHTGFMLYDPEKKKTLYQYNSDRYFTPASNTKIFTLFASLNIIGDSIPALHYSESGDSVIFWGTGDPSFLYENVFDNRRVFNFLSSIRGNLYYLSPKYFTTHFGPGWSWEDYNFTFSSERSPFPVFGNTFKIRKINNELKVTPSYFKTFVSVGDTLERSNADRSPISNNVYYFPGRDTTSKWTRPFITDSSLVARLLSDTLKRVVKPISNGSNNSFKTIYSIPSDSLYKVMMQESDNFIAEQLLIVCASVLGDTLKPEGPINYVTKNYLQDLPDKVVWRDGSGLSRYNLFTPRSVVKVWDKIYDMIPRERLFKIVAIGGVAGTIKNSYKADKPYIFGKTGSLSNVHCLSGYLITKKGKTLIFSFMNTNFTAPIREIRNRMEEILTLIRDNN
ncbi:MAG TPA: D-alanyl-D-alanine carboxypeptidase [Cyclobacteriaceae bacterium]|nr:D-alanyl-D-alanine carboxypeptidase [Cyclobacteriaceae bacterium]